MSVLYLKMREIMYVFLIITSVGLTVYGRDKEYRLNYIAVFFFFLANIAKLYELSYDFSVVNCFIISINTMSIFLHGRIIEMKRVLEKRKGRAMINIDLSEGNPGALIFMLDAHEKNPFAAELAFERMNKFSIKGSKLYILWNDCCKRDTEKTLQVMLNKPIAEIIDHINYNDICGIPFD